MWRKLWRWWWSSLLLQQAVYCTLKRRAIEEDNLEENIPLDESFLFGGHLDNIYQEQKVYNGDDAKVGTIPFQIRLTISHKRKTYLCGGAVLSEQWAVTAAHCIIRDIYEAGCNDNSYDCEYEGSAIYNPSETTVYVGDFNQMKSEDTEQVRHAELIIPHPQYDAYSLTHDIALLRFEKALVFNDYVSAISLSNYLPSAEDNVTIAGWGLTETGSLSKRLQFASYGVPTNDSCEARYNELWVQVDESMWCSGHGDMSTRTGVGDSGGPIYWTRDDTPYLVGLTSWGPHDFVGNDWDVNTNIPFLRNWIKSTMTRETKNLTASTEVQSYSWNNDDLPYQFQRIRISCQSNNCQVQMTDVEFITNNAEYSTITVTDPNLAATIHPYNDNYTASEMIIVISTDDKADTVSLSFSYTSRILDCSELGEDKLCDEVNDCADLSDELGCKYGYTEHQWDSSAGCYPGDFQCPSNGSCIRSKYKCDGYSDCPGFDIDTAPEEEIGMCAAASSYYKYSVLIVGVIALLK